MEEQAECIFVPQRLYDFWLMYFGLRRSKQMRRTAPDYYPMDKKHPQYKSGRMRGFLSARDWIAHMEEMDFCFGSRIHGSLAAVNAGIPAVVLAADLRIEELVRYHGISYVQRSEMNDVDVQKAYERSDFTEFARKYDENFRRYTDFLDACGIDHIYRENMPAWGEAPLDKAVARLPEMPVIRPDMQLSFEDRIWNLKMYAWLMMNTIRRISK